MRLLHHIPSWLKNKYFIAIACFAVIMLFLDKNDIFTQVARQKEMREMEQSKVHYTKEINELTKMKEGLMNDPATIEKYARENALMKRDNEDLFLVPEMPENDKN